MSAAAITGEQHLETGSAQKWLIALAVMLGTTLEVLDTSIVNVALPHMQGSFSASVDEIAWVVTSYLVANGIMIPMTGWISSRFGRKRYFMASVGVFVVASGFCGAAASLNQMVIFRLIQGAAGAAMIPSSQAILMETFPPAEQQLAMAMWGVGLMVAPIMGPTLGGWITDNWNWRWNFYINLPIGLAALLMVYTFVHDPAYLRQRRARGGRVDYIGIACLVLGLGMMQIVLDRGQRADWFNSAWVWYFTAASAAALIILVIHELRFPEPILDLRIMAIPAFDLSVTLIVAMSFALYGTGLLNPIFLQELMGYTAWRAGLVLAPRGLGTMVSMLLIGQLARFKFDTRPLVGLGFVLMATSLWTMSKWNLNVSSWVVIWPSITMGIGMGFIFPTLVGGDTFGRQSRADGLRGKPVQHDAQRRRGDRYFIHDNHAGESSADSSESYLVEHFSVFDAWRMSNAAPRMAGGHGFYFTPQLGDAGHQSFAGVYGMIQQQASMLAFNDIYRVLAIWMVLLIPSFLLLRRGAASSSAAH